MKMPRNLGLVSQKLSVVRQLPDDIISRNMLLMILVEKCHILQVPKNKTKKNQARSEVNLFKETTS